MSEKEAIKHIVRDPVGHSPLTFLQRTPDGKAYFKNDRGDLKISDFLLGPTEKHINAFIEYERTFGRGTAFNFTHAHRGGPLEPAHRSNIKYARLAGIEISDENAVAAMEMYNGLADRISNILASGDSKELDATILTCREFRKKFPALYPELGPKKKFVIRS